VERNLSKVRRNSMSKFKETIRTILGGALMLFGIIVLLTVFNGTPLFNLGPKIGTTSGIAGLFLVVGALLIRKQ
jgi:hypothetical protein